MKKYKKLFEDGNKAQFEQMERHSSKRGWHKFPIRDGFEGVRRSCISLDDHLYHLFTHKPIGLEELDYDYIRKKAANIANFAHMIILTCNKRLEKQ